LKRLWQKVLDRVYRPYYAWEEVRHNMWGTVSDRDYYLQKAVEFTGNHALYGSYMMRVIREWPISCENALTDSLLNKKAWVGHAACAMALGCPEDVTRKAWGFLNDEQRLLANREAEKAIAEWVENYRKDRPIPDHVADQMLLNWDS
jgi:hypothetical protein